MFRSFFTTIFRGSSAVLCAVTIPPATHYRSPTDKNTKHTHMIYTCGHILRNNTNSKNANQREAHGTKHSGGLPEDGREKRPKHVEVLYSQTSF